MISKRPLMTVNAREIVPANASGELLGQSILRCLSGSSLSGTEVSAHARTCGMMSGHII